MPTAETTGGPTVRSFGLTDAAARARYDALFADCPEAFVQQSTDWAEVIAPLGPDEPIFLLAEDGAGQAIGGLPLYLFRAAPGPILTSVPQPGPLGGVFCRPGTDADAVYRALLDAAGRLARERGCLTLSLITNPLRDDLARYEQALGPDMVMENFTQIVPLDTAVGDGRLLVPDNKQRNRGWRVRRARKFGFEIGLCEDPADFERWYAVHRRRHEEIGARPLEHALLHGIWSRLGPRGKALLFLAKREAEVGAGILYVCHRDVADAFMLSTDSAHASASPNYLLMEQSLIALAARGVRHMNWQSSPRRDDGVYRFKRVWGAVEHTYAFVTRCVADGGHLLALGPQGVRAAYPNHFVLPFGAFERGEAKGRFEKP